MLRILLTYVLPLIAPTLVYLLWRLWWIRRHAADGTASGRTSEIWSGMPWVRLTAAGTGLLALVLAVAALTGGSPPGEDYVPPRVEDGRVVPGETRSVPGGHP